MLFRSLAKAEIMSCCFPSIVRERSRRYLETSICVRSGSAATRKEEEGRYLDSSSAGDDLVVLDSPLDDHDRIMQTPLHLANKLLRPSPQQQRARHRLPAPLKQVEPLPTNLPLLKALTAPEVLRPDIRARTLRRSAHRLDDALEVVRCDAAGAEDVAVGEELGREVADRQAREDDFGARGGDRFELGVDDGPFRVDDRLVFLWSRGGVSEAGERERRERTETASMRTSALSRSALSSSSTLRQTILGFLKLLGCCSNPA